MYTDPWDLKHSIEQIQQQQRQNKHFIPQQQHSSSTYSDHLNQDTITPNSQLDLSQDHHEEQTNSDQNTTNHREKQSYSKPLQNSYEYASQVQFVKKSQSQKPRKKYGNLIIFIQTKNFILSIGPNYLFFFFAYLSFTAASIYLVYLVNLSLQNIPFKIGNFIFVTLQNISYILVAFSNPGIKLPETDIIMSSEIDQHRLCRTCKAVQQRKTYHCRQCDICVQDYDHHCPWTSKCIGGGNLKRFYFFVCITPFYIFYYVVAFMICMASLTVPHSKNIRPLVPTAPS